MLRLINRILLVRLVAKALKSAKLTQAALYTSIESQVWDILMKYNKSRERIWFEEFTEKESKLAVENFLRVVPYLDLIAAMAVKLSSKKGEEVN